MDDIRTGTCPLCAHDEILETVPLEFSGEFHREREMYAAWGKRTVRSWLDADRDVVDQERPYGKMSLFVCRACGFSQWFASRPADIPIGDDAGTRLIRGRKAPPYR